MNSSRTALIAALLAACGLAALGAVVGGTTSGAHEVRGRARILQCIQAVTPSDVGDPRFDAILGGRVGPGRWRYYETGYGTTCAIYVTYALECAGAPASCLNRGQAFKPGAHLVPLLDCARAWGAYKPGFDGARPGDIYYVSNTPAAWHVGVLISSIGTNVVTADGGQTNAKGQQCARLVRRVLQRDPGGRVALSGPNGFGGFRVVRWHIDVSRLLQHGGSA